MRRSEIRELAFKLVYSLQIQKIDDLEEQISLYIESNDIEDLSAREYIKDIILGINQNKEEITDIIKNSYEKDDIIMSEEIYDVMNELRDYMFKNIYASESSAKSEEVKAEGVIENLFYTYMKDESQLPQTIKASIKQYGKEQAVCDYIAGMSDGYALREYERLFVPRSWQKD